jgi:hypothetical protein
MTKDVENYINHFDNSRILQKIRVKIVDYGVIAYNDGQPNRSYVVFRGNIVTAHGVLPPKDYRVYLPYVFRKSRAASIVHYVHKRYNKVEETL